MKDPFPKAILPAMIASILVLSGCGSSSDDSADDSASNDGAVTAGVITGFGSVYVNGIKFDTDSSVFDIDDDDAADQNDLRVGMLVKVNGSINSDGVTGTASQITYDNELEGPVSAIDNTDPANIILTVLGIAVTVNADTTFDDDFNLDPGSILVGDLLEISGFTTSNGITATHIEKQGDFIADLSDIEIKGEITNLTATNFTIKGLSVAYDSNTKLEDITGNTLSDGLLVEAKGTLNTAGDLLSATKIEAEDDGLGDDVDEVELEGIIYDYNATDQMFMIQGQSVSFSNNTDLMPSSLILADDIKVEVEGELVNGILIAEEINLNGRKIKIQATVSAIDTTAETVSFSVFGGSNNVTVRVNQQTEMEDDVLSVSPFSINQLVEGDYVEVEAFDDGSSDINAIELKRKEADDIQLEGPISAYDATLQTVSLFGQTLDLTNAKYEADSSDKEILAAEFYSALAIGTFVELTDEDPDGADSPDGIIDKAEIEEEDDD